MLNFRFILILVCFYYVTTVTCESEQNTFPKHVLEINSQAQHDFIESFDLLLSDLDGVLWIENLLIPNSSDTINYLQQCGKRCAFVSNNAFRSEAEFKQKFNAAGINLDLQTDLLNPTKNIISYLKDNRMEEAIIYCVGSDSLKASLRMAGFKVIDSPNRIFNESFDELTKYVVEDSHVKVVVIEFDINMSGAKLMRAQYYLMNNPDSILIIGATDLLTPLIPNFNIIGPGYFANIIADVTGKTPIVLGKPGAELCKITMNKFGIKDPKRVLMVGDMLAQDIGFGKTCGFQTLAVLSGGTKIEDLKNPSNSHLLPNYYADKLGDLLLFHKFWNNCNQNN